MNIRRPSFNPRSPIIADTETKLTPKAQRTRERIVETALSLFATRGYQETTLRDIATEAGISLGLTYRYFSRKEELILELYGKLAAELAEQVKSIPRAPLAARFKEMIAADLARLQPHRESLAALFGAALAPGSEIAVLGEKVRDVRQDVWRTCLVVVQGASDCPRRAAQREQLATLFYSLHLTFVLFWLQDRTPEQLSTRQLLDFTEEQVGRLRPALSLPFVASAVTRLVGILNPMFGPTLPEAGMSTGPESSLSDVDEINDDALGAPKRSAILK